MAENDENCIPRNPKEIRDATVIDMTGIQDEEGDCPAQEFCGVCLKNLQQVNFLLRMKHVKECCRIYGSKDVSEKIVSGSRALKLFLEHHGCAEYYDRFIAGGFVKDLSHIHGMSSGDLRRVQEKIGGKKKIELALEHYAVHGQLPLRASLLARNGSERKVATHRKRKTNGSLMQQQQQKGALGAKPTRAPQSVGKHGAVGSIRSVEKMLFLSIYDENSVVQSCRGREEKSIVCERNGEVAAIESIWAGAGRCGFELRSGSLEKRLALKRGTDKGERGTRGRNDGDEEMIAVKRVRLKAMEDELLVQLSTVKQLEGMIASLKKEIDDYYLFNTS